jgi:uncharacterized membrane protein YozB (DUF420 family)
MTTEHAGPSTPPSSDTAGTAPGLGTERRHRIERVASTVAFAVAAVLLTSGFATGDRATGTSTVATIETHPTVPALVVSALTLTVLLVAQRRTDTDARAHARAIRTAAVVFLVVSVLATIWLGVHVQSALLGWPGAGSSGATPWWSDAVVDSFEVH